MLHGSQPQSQRRLSRDTSLDYADGFYGPNVTVT